MVLARFRRAVEGHRVRVRENNPDQRHRDFEFNLRELAGSMGDFGTLLPLAIGYIAVCGLDPAGLFIWMGLVNIATGVIYRLPMPVEPKKVIAVAAISQRWSPSLVYASGLGLGITWFVLTLSGLMRHIVRWTPMFVARGIQLALGITLAWQGLKLMRPDPLLGLVAIVIVFLLRKSRYAPATIVLMLLGVGIIGWRGQLGQSLELTISLPPLTLPRLDDVWQAMLLAGFAQIPLSITNAVIATAALIRDYFPGKPVKEERLMLNMGFMNVIPAFFGGMPMCHGAGGLAGQYYFGARTGGANIIEGLIEISLGLFLGKSIGNLLTAFPMPLVGAMMLLVGIELGRVVLKLKGWGLRVAVFTAAFSVVANMAVGFGAGLAVAYLVRALKHRRLLPCACSKS
ncbi:MAG: putative sulfate/molybdate transporter [Anaerolineae bacterium]|nr:putative sulfate/molybdate transporter [Anaerolineae bacterium]